LLDEFYQHAVIAEGSLFGQRFDLAGDLGRQSYASPDVLCGAGLCMRSFSNWHGGTSIHHCGAVLGNGQSVLGYLPALAMM
jgi:hypothetical protein